MNTQISPDNKDRPSGHILTIIGLEETQGVQVSYWPHRNIFHAVTTGREDSNLERLIDTVRAHWNDPDNSDSENRAYRSGYDYACGYYD